MAIFLTFTDGDGSMPGIDDGAVVAETEAGDDPEPRKDFPETWLWNIVTTEYELKT